ncbi:MAG: prepilin-type N-terminal cleavage/methylation domain-containing protein [Alphaproteobacteria bacterium]|nr:prepilin-type N-terminal cleavage/methylation domain-containing protein [Alphaproteobacteria bacterium]
MKNRYNSGYSLVEIAIVLIIIGLIIGGVLKGKDLIESARIKSVIAQVNGYRLAVSSFKEMFDALPGDFSAASQQIDADLSNGNGNGQIEGSGMSAASESGQFWVHLAGAELIAEPGRGQGNVLVFDGGVPSSALGGGFTVTYKDGKHWFVLGNASEGSNLTALLTPQQAKRLDAKMDNGNPLRGTILAVDGLDVPRGSCVNAAGQYNLLNKKPACVLYFEF